MSNHVIRSDGVSKYYRIIGKQKNQMLRDRIQETFSSAVKRILHPNSRMRGNSSPSSIWALKNVSFEINQGQSVGIIGANGAGKTTLLKILSRITAPTEGKVYMRGRVGSLLEVGTGFHSELTGRENVYLNGAILGMRKSEIDRKFSEIVDFSGVETFIDTPVKRYSSGMRMRLAFSVAAHLEPEILLIDEVLAVGDVAFQKKSLNKMESVTHEGRTVLFVSHNLAAVKSFCPQSIFLDQGKLIYYGDTENAIQEYLKATEINFEQTQVQEQAIKPRKKVQILSIYPCDIDGSNQGQFPHNHPVYVRIKVSLNATYYKTHLILKLYDSNMNLLFASYDFEPDGNSLISDDPGIYEFQAQIPENYLTPGKYYLGAQVSMQSAKNRIRPLDKLDQSSHFEVIDNGSILAKLNIPWQGLVHPKINWERLRKKER